MILFKNLRKNFEDRYLQDRGYGSGRLFFEKLLDTIEAGDILLDVGCGEGAIKQRIPEDVYYVGLDRYFGEQTNEYADWYMRPTVLGDMHVLPLTNASCKAAALFQVLEHANQPEQVLREIQRVLKPSGFLFVTVPFLHEIHHAPYDFFRYTPYGLAHLANTVGFEVIEIRPSGGYFRALAYMLESAPTVLTGESKFALFLKILVAYPLKGLGWLLRKSQYLLDICDEKQAFTSGYDCVFRKV